MRTALAWVTMVALTTPAVAQPGATPPSSPTWSPPPASEPLVVSPGLPAPYGVRTAPVQRAKEPAAAGLLSLGVTTAGLLGLVAGASNGNDTLAWIGLGATLAGPSAGHVYAGETAHAVGMSLLRTVGFAVFAKGLAENDTRNACDSGLTRNWCEDNREGEGKMWIGGAIVLGATVYDLFDSARAARRANDRQRRAMMVAPTMVGGRNGPMPAVGISGQF